MYGVYQDDISLIQREGDVDVLVIVCFLDV